MNNQKLQKWISLLDRISPEIFYLLDNRKVFKFLVGQHNTGKMADPRLWSFIKSNYAGNMTVSICRQIDMDSKAVSMLKLMEDLCINSNMLTKEWFTSDYEWATGDLIFKQLFGDGDVIKIDLLENDIVKLRESSEAIRNHRDKRIAHSDKNQKIPREPVFDEIDSCVDFLEELFNKYHYLLKKSNHQFPR